MLTAAPLTEAAAARSRDDLLRFLRLLATAVAIALAVACVNVANLMLMRGTERQRELSIRAAVGASRRRVVRQLLVESTTLALAGGVLGVGIALLALRLLTAFALPGGIALSELALPMDARVLGFTAAVSMLCALGFGLAPALSGSRVDLMNAMRGVGESASGRWRGGSALLAVQVGLSLVLLVAGSLFVRSLQQALSVDLGFRSDGVAAVAVGLQQHGYSGDDADLFVTRVLEETLRQPGVHRVAAGSRVPLEGSSRLPVSPGPGRGGATAGADRREATAIITISPGYLDAVGLRLLRGRDIEWSDREGTPLVALVTESAARRMWPDEEAVGQELVVLFGQPYTVVGVVADAHLARLTDTEPHVFLAMLQRRTFTMDRMRLVAAADNPGVALGALRSAVQAVDRRLPTYQERSLQQHVAALLMPQRFGSILLAAFGVVALLIAAVGIYAVASYDVARRYREIGIRAALGAGRLQLLRLVLSRAGASIAAGIAAGVLLAAFATRGLQTLLFGISHYDAVSYVAAVLVLALVAVGASWLPARRAARVDPLVVMRE
jgi:putative ABC transport system permease protein